MAMVSSLICASVVWTSIAASAIAVTISSSGACFTPCSLAVAAADGAMGRAILVIISNA